MTTGKPRGRWSTPFLIALAVVPAVALRIFAFAANETPHGDVTVSALVTESVMEGDGLVIPARWLRPYPTEAWGGGMPIDGQPPLWPLLAAPVAAVSSDGYVAVRVLSLLTGVLLLPIAYVAFWKLFARETAALTTVAIAYAWLLIDYSGNGSLYSLLGIAFVAFAHLLAKPPSFERSVSLGVVFGLAMLLHQGALALLVALVLETVLAWVRGNARRAHTRSLVIALAAAALVLTPWWIRNLRLFGNPFFQSHYLFVLHRMGVPWHLVDAGVRDFVVEFDGVSMVHALRALALWFVDNAWFLGRALLRLVPLFVPFAVYRGVTLVRGWRPEAGRTSVVAIPVVYGAIACVWPVFQFRCLVPILPFVIGLGADAMLRLPRRLRGGAAVTAVLSLLIASGVAAWQAPTHTFYYGAGEATYQAQQAEVREVCRTLSTLEIAQVASDELTVHFYTRYPWTFLPPGLPVEEIPRFVGRYDIRYIVAGHREAERYEAALETRTHHDGRYFVLLEVSGVETRETESGDE